jgi:membrane-associated protease RseP (regulator of RpoE activity)
MGPEDERGDSEEVADEGSDFAPPSARFQPEAMPVGSTPRRRRIWLPVILFLATVFTTFCSHGVRLYYPPWHVEVRPWSGLAYSAAVMTILMAHELGHFFQALRYRVPVSLPFFIPVPFGPIGTMGAVIAMRAHIGDRRALFDIGITGPLAGLLPTIAFCAWGLSMSEVGAVAHGPGVWRFGEPLLFQWLAHWMLGPLPDGHEVLAHPVAFAGWVGIFITALNLFPIGQLDGGHILYALLRKRAYPIAAIVLMGCIIGMVVSQYWGWSLMLLLLLMMGPRHPPTADDNARLGFWRIALGWLALAFVPIGFTPMPFLF